MSTDTPTQTVDTTDFDQEIDLKRQEINNNPYLTEEQKQDMLARAGKNNVPVSRLVEENMRDNVIWMSSDIGEGKLNTLQLLQTEGKTRIVLTVGKPDTPAFRMQLDTEFPISEMIPNAPNGDPYIQLSGGWEDPEHEDEPGSKYLFDRLLTFRTTEGDTILIRWTGMHQNPMKDGEVFPIKDKLMMEGEYPQPSVEEAIVEWEAENEEV